MNTKIFDEKDLEELQDSFDYALRDPANSEAVEPLVDFTLESAAQYKVTHPKQIKFHGHEIYVPQEVQYVAVAADGTLLALRTAFDSEEPRLNRTLSTWSVDNGGIVNIGWVQYKGSWEHSLVKI